MEAVVLACAAQAVYVIAFVFFKAAATRMAPLSGRRPVEVVHTLIAEPRWLLGFVVILAGTAMAALALTTLPLAMALLAYGFSLALLLLVGVGMFGERLSPREWLAIAVIGVALVILAGSIGLGSLPRPTDGLVSVPTRFAGPDISVPAWKFTLVVVPSVVIPLWLFAARDRDMAGRHARPLSGVAYGIGAGVLLGTAEVFSLGIVQTVADQHRNVLDTPYLYFFLVAGTLGLGLVQIGLQRCRLIVIITVVTVTAKSQLVLAGTVLYEASWPHEQHRLVIQIGAICLALLAVLTLPRFRPTP